MATFLEGALTMGFLVAGVFFLRFWKRTHDRLFLAFAIAFALFALNQIAAFATNVTDESAGYAYLLRVLGFVVIIAAIVDKNSTNPGTRK